MQSDTSILKDRIRNVRAKLQSAKIDALVVTVCSNVTYLSGFTGDDSWLILTGRLVFLVTDSRYTLQAKNECPACKIYQRKGSMIDAVADIFKKLPKIKTIVVEDKIKLAVFNILRKKLKARLKPVKNLVESARSTKDESEISAIKKAIDISQKSLVKVLPKIRIGISETELAAMLDFEMKKAGAAGAFETIVAFGSNSAMAHHRPTNRKLKKVDTILFDFGAKFNGYCADMTRCFATGRVNNFYAKVYKTVLEAQTAAINILKSGIKAKVADVAAKDIIKAAKLPPYDHGLGHGVGLDVHEQPVVSVISKASLQNGSVITVEPAVYLPGKFGIRIEDDVLVTENGCEILTSLLKSDEVPLLKLK
jgi:Xaa-Pro aminopeptidase